jgi:hypothetical protein
MPGQLFEQYEPRSQVSFSHHEPQGRHPHRTTTTTAASAGRCGDGSEAPLAAVPRHVRPAARLEHEQRHEAQGPGLELNPRTDHRRVGIARGRRRSRVSRWSPGGRWGEELEEHGEGRHRDLKSVRRRGRARFIVWVGNEQRIPMTLRPSGFMTRGAVWGGGPQDPAFERINHTSHHKNKITMLRAALAAKLCFGLNHLRRGGAHGGEGRG